MLTGLERGDGWRDVLGLAIGASAANAETPGAGRFDPAWAAALAREAEVTRL
jgi:hypothetical protein